MFGNLEEKQNEIKEKLKAIELSGSTGDGAVSVKANAAGVILDINIDFQKIDLEDSAHIEDLMVIAINDVLSQAKFQEQQVSQQMVNDLLPGGLGGLKDLFG
jgi:DNA-binding protein YbaB